MKEPLFSILEDLSLPEYRARHIFIAKLRLSIFIGFWFLYVLFLKECLSETKPVTVTILISFFVTTACYYNIFNNKYIILSFTLEILSDLVAMTAIIYLTGGLESEYYIIYIFYAITAGLFYNYRLALFVSILSTIFYGIFIAFTKYGLLHPLVISGTSAAIISARLSNAHPILLAVFLALAVYATRIAHIFTQNRERMLEERNTELLALQQMSSTIRTITSLENVLAQVVNGVTEGLNLSLCLLMFYEKDEGIIRCIPPSANVNARRAEEILGIELHQLYFPAVISDENSAFAQIRQGQIIFRREISELIAGIQPEIEAGKLVQLQEEFGVKRVIAIPLVTGREVIGCLIGFASETFVEANKVHTFQAFADQAALAIEAAILISELRKKNIALIEANRVKSEFLATMSHELRTPMTAVIGFTELMLEGVMGEVSEEQTDSLREVLTNANSLLEMINNLLDLAKVEAGKMKLSKYSFDWNEMVKRVERSVSALIKKKNHNLTVMAKGDLPPVFADEKRMQQAVLNLLSNAIKFTPSSGSIHIFTEFFGDITKFASIYGIKKDLASERFEKGVIACSVEDTGIGIPEKHIDAIFDVFQQVDSSVTKSYEGSGLGLALVKQFVELHGGHVWVKSHEGRGTKFTFIVPVDNSPPL